MKTRAHVRYRLQSGVQCPGVTSITGILAKFPLYNWYWKLGRDGIDHRKHLDFLADIGTLSHAMIFHHLKDTYIETGDYSQNQIELATNSFESFLKWEKQHELKPILLEGQLVSEEHKYGGTPDYFGFVDEELTVLDFKSSGIYDDQFIQLAGYENLLKEVGHKVNACRILVIPTAKDKGFREAQREDVSVHWEIFLRCLDIYKLRKELR